ncbi:hypothetical protein [Allopontixanthobacter sp.]|uniref:hypothetical protein n=1 Tax=Allopontixanthobacter sp. TaxID=2906452 RepID=UPI002ABC1475|nr:hypothetical protein [Allopontixanthobacter sp.]MDZ4307435.1 hypothetical protein [Allopontixanthobacter sp.]
MTGRISPFSIPFHGDALSSRIAFILLCVLFSFPHAVQAFSALLFLALAFFAVIVMIREGDRQTLSLLIPWFGISVIVNGIYIAIGQNRGAPLEAALQSVAVFVAAPIFWLLIFLAVRRQFSEVAIFRLFEAIALMSALSVALFFYIFLTFGADAAKIFSSEPNVLVREGTVSATMHVYATLVFISSAMLSVPDIYRKGIWQLFMPLVLIVVALTSGRSALLVACAIGAVSGLVLRPFIISDRVAGAVKKPGLFLRALLFGTGGLVLMALLASFLEMVDIGVVVEALAEKVLSGGGVERTTQYFSLLDGIAATNGFGAGHGIGVAYVRDFEYPWRYEIFALASIYRLGVFGFLLTFIPFAVYLGAFVRTAARRQLRPLDVFLFSGWLAIALASFTNPYPESFIYLGLLMGPVVLFPYARATDTRAVRGSDTPSGAAG